MGDERRRNGQNAAAMQVKGQARTWLLGLALAGCLALVACGGGDGDGGEQSIETLDVQELLDSAVIQFTELESFHFALDFGGDTSPLEQLSIDMEKIEGDVIIPDKLKAAVKAKVRSMGGINVNVSLVGVGEEAWVTNPFDPSVWLELESGNPLNGLFNPSDGVAAVIRGAADPAVTGEEVLEGVDTWKVTGTIDSGDLTAFLDTAESGYPVAGTIWIGKADNIIYRIHLVGQLTAAEPVDIVRNLTFSSFNDVEPIEPP
ncbi:MAG: LppX_LprAFG lipoprotein [Dehalococcoidia bacterium]|nr:LppX_LprAFG lipoprotein [Dehalococcoidia bacterium]MYI86657.1 LppX_LprAFG lipoprotein [Dehalococcoidia bacterium]